MTFGNPYKNNGGGRSEELTQSYGLYTGAQLTNNLQAYTLLVKPHHQTIKTHRMMVLTQDQYKRTKSPFLGLL